MRLLQRIGAGVGLVVVAGAIPVAAALFGCVSQASGDVRVTRDDTSGSYDAVAGPEDSISEACATRRRQQVEPSVAVNPHDPRVIAVGAMDACIAVRSPLPLPQAQHWLGLYRSFDGGASWKASLLPGYADYPTGETKGCEQQADSTLSFDRAGRLFYGSLCPVFAGASPRDFRIAVSIFDRDGRRYRRTTRVDLPVGKEADGSFGSDKPNLAVDQGAGRYAGNVYVAWSHCLRIGPSPCSRYQDDAVLRVARSTDHGRSFDTPITIKTPKLPLPFFADVAVGPNGIVYVTFKVDRRPGQGSPEIWLARSVNGGRSFSPARLVQTIEPFDSSQYSGSVSDCGDGSFSCPGGFDFPVFRSFSAITADDSGVHLAWGARAVDGQGQIFVRNSPDGVRWPTPAVAIDPVPSGHQWWPDIASADGVISVVFLDSRGDPAYAPGLPPGNTAAGTSSGPAVDAYVAQSSDGGESWQEQRLSTVTSEPNFETYLDARLPWRGDYMYVSAVKGASFAVWPDSRDVVAGDDTRADSEENGFDVFAPCGWAPDTVTITGAYTAPPPTDPCLDQGGLDLNVYGAALPD